MNIAALNVTAITTADGYIANDVVIENVDLDSDINEQIFVSLRNDFNIDAVSFDWELNRIG